MFVLFPRLCALPLLSLIIAALCSHSYGEVSGRPDRNSIVFGYMQTNGSAPNLISRNYRWHAFTHIAPPPVGFDSAGVLNTTSWNARDNDLKPVSASNPQGGAATNHGVKITCDIVNAGFAESIVNTIMPNAGLRTTLTNNIVALVTDPVNGCDGVALDLEWTGGSWNTSARAGINLFCAELNTALKALSPPRELFFYVYPTYSSSLYSIPGLAANVDYILYSGYDFSSASTVSAVGKYGNPVSGTNMINNLNTYVNQGVPLEKMVMTLPLFGKTWNSTGVYGSAGSGRVSASWTQTNFDTDFNGYTRQRSSNTDHARWYSFVSGVDKISTFEDPETLELKMRLQKVWKGSISNGKRLAGIGFWSLIWPSQGITPNGCDPNTSVVSTTLRRTHNMPYTLMEELVAPPGTREFRAETFEALSLNENWVPPTDGPDDVNLTAASVTSQLIPAGGPVGSHRVAQLGFSFAGAANRLLFKFRVLADFNSPFRIDYHTALVSVDATTSFAADIHVPAALPGATLRMVVKDGNHQLEKGPAVSLATAGWKRVQWDLTSTAPGNVTAYTTAEGAFATGDGIIQTAGAGKRDIAFVGFEITNSASVSNAVVNFDRIVYAHANPGGKNYLINELRYADPAHQFVEIYGPAGPLPSTMRLSIVNGTAGTPTTVMNLAGGSIPNDTGTGFGYYVVASAGVPNADVTLAAALPAGGSNAPGALQLADTATSTVFDEVVYSAFGGLGTLDSPGTPIVSDGGPGWYGEVPPGATSAGVKHSVGRYPNGANTGIQAKDISLMVGSPGVSNGGSITIPFTSSFSSATGNAFISRNVATANTFAVQAPDVSVGPSPGGGNVHRCVNTTGDASVSFWGDAALGYNGSAYDVTGRLYVPADGGAATAHAIGLGLCGRAGSDFFSPTPGASGYDSGYWLVYESTAGVALADGQPDHPGVFQFVWASNDGQDALPSIALSSKTLAQLGVTAGTWTTFRLSINPSGSGDKLLAAINGVAVYSGPIPTGGPVSGAFQLGFRKNHAGNPTSAEGTWIDDLAITSSAVPVALTSFSVE